MVMVDTTMKTHFSKWLKKWYHLKLFNIISKFDFIIIIIIFLILVDIHFMISN